MQPVPRTRFVDDFEQMSTKNTLPKVFSTGQTSFGSLESPPPPASRAVASPAYSTPARVASVVAANHAVNADTPIPHTARQHKRAWLDQHCGTLVGTPEKERRLTRSGPMQRAPRVQNGLLQARPHSSSAYTRYRPSVSFGLTNLGNTCYLNAVMQVFGSLREFTADLRSMEKTVPSVKEGGLYKCTTEVLERMNVQSHGPQSPAKLRERIALASPAFGGHEQQDAHEFFSRVY